MPDAPTLSTLAEVAIRRLTARAAMHAAGLGGPVGEPGRHLPARELDSDVNALVDLVAVTESYFADRLAEATPATKQPTTWHARGKAWRDATGFNVAADPRWPVLMGFVEARNALQHGLGRLTELQLDPTSHRGREPRRTQVLRDLAACGVVLNGDRVTVLPRDVERCLVACRELVLTADEALWRAGVAAGRQRC